MRQAALFHVGGWVDARPGLGAIAKALPAGWKAERYFYSDKNPKFKTPPPNEKNVLAALNAGAGLVVHVGHGSEHTWHGCFSVGSLEQVKNADRLPIRGKIGQHGRSPDRLNDIGPIAFRNR